MKCGFVELRLESIMGQEILEKSIKKELDIGQLFQLSANLYLHQPISPNLLKSIEDLIPEHCILYILSGKRFLHPTGFEPIAPMHIWNMIGNNSIGIFRRQVQILSDNGNFSDFTICASNMGKDVFKDDIAVGLLYGDGWVGSSEVEEEFYQIISQVERFYAAFTESSKVRNFLMDDNSFRYVIEAQSSRIIVQLRPESEIWDTALESIDDYVSGNLLPGLLHPNAESDSQISLDNRLKNLNISKCTLLTYYFVLLTFAMADPETKDRKEYDLLIRNFAHKIKGKLGALQAATSQLTHQKGQKLDDDDVTLLNIAKRASDSICNLIERLHKYSYADVRVHSPLDLNSIIERVAAQKMNITGSKLQLEINLDPNLKSFNGDAEQIESTLWELMDNADTYSVPGTKIKINTIQQEHNVSFSIKNEMPNLTGHSDYMNKSDYCEPFYALESEKAGMGLTIARRIIANHGGKIRIKSGQDNAFQVEVELPVLTKGVDKVDS